MAKVYSQKVCSTSYKNGQSTLEMNGTTSVQEIFVLENKAPMAPVAPEILNKYLKNKRR